MDYKYYFVMIGLIGILLILFSGAYFIRKFPTFKNRIAKTTKTRELLLSTFNVLIIAAAMTVSLFALQITAGGGQMTRDELSRLASDINTYIALSWTLFGVALGVFIFFIIEFCKKNEETQPPLNLVGDTKAEGQQTKPKINIALKVDTADISKMNNEQLKAVKDYIKQLQEKDTNIKR